MSAAMGFGIGVALCLAMGAAAVAAAHRERLFGKLAATESGSARSAEWSGQRRVLWQHARMGGLAVGAVFFGYRLGGPVGAVAALLGAWACVRSLEQRTRRGELARDEDQIADLASALAAATRAGRSIRGALSEALREAESPMRERLERVLARIQVGETLDEAMIELGSSPDARLVAALLAVHGRTGGDLAGLLEEVASIVLRRIEMRRQARALAAQGRASGTVLAVLPVAFVGLLSGVGGDGLGAFYRTPLGSLLLGSGCLLGWLGFRWLRSVAAAGEQA